ncbi:uncharacterized protein [Melanerpes formicivorus]|uniref:uncharacterized protein n=1 Tax=Melanerpes formicivorus TaxID=211600 RepID=UPI00358EE2A7
MATPWPANTISFIDVALKNESNNPSSSQGHDPVGQGLLQPLTCSTASSPASFFHLTLKKQGKKSCLHSGNFDSIWQKQTHLLNKKGTGMESKWVTSRSSLFLLTLWLQVTKSPWCLVRRSIHLKICSVTRTPKCFPGCMALQALGAEEDLSLLWDCLVICSSIPISSVKESTGRSNPLSMLV